jgi:hypothetical protein
MAYLPRHMRLLTILLLISLSMICNNSCTSGTPQTTPTKPEGDALVGRVASIYLEQNYMLVQKYRSFETDLDAIFYSRGVDGSVNALKMTGQKLGQFYIADLSNGNYTVNDPVFMRDLRNSSQVDTYKPAGTDLSR